MPENIFKLIYLCRKLNFHFNFTKYIKIYLFILEIKINFHYILIDQA
jgi:hypothetical protein